MKTRVLFWGLILFVLLDLAFTFLQANQLPLEGDMIDIVLPGPTCRQVLHDPFGWAALTRNEVYVAPNRFFAHAAMSGYFKTMPFALQRLMPPIASVYAACALFAVAVQALLLYVLAVYSTSSYSLRRWQLWAAAALLVPLFQLGGYNDQIGILDRAITYTFFYAFPLTLLLLLLLPFYLAARRGEPLRLSWPRRLALVALMVVLAFNGAIITGVVTVLFFGIGVHWLRKQWQAGARFGLGQWLSRVRQLPVLPVALLGIFTLLCLYSLYIGQNELESTEHMLPLWQRYARIPSGIYWQLHRLGLPLLLLATLLNLVLIRRQLPASDESRHIFRMLQWLVLFSVLYVLLLPLGGYRNYRPLIIRRDSIMPLLLGLMFLYGLSTQLLLRQLPRRPHRYYLAGVLAFSAFFMLSDQLQLTNNNDCERASLARLAASPEPVVRLSEGCTVAAWWKINAPQYSETSAQLIQYWGITKDEKRYYLQGW
ncbi:hypothetical protein [Hymenobacter yonginensis]|uniref:Glycosyltransferase RgtA/B/C/D-like domain-containing protein n=1 Tax=Hymenobacter yonginensis TaxID=748197 RepID=A0ABY7PP92_9BACT|nr:hypothetical protein [Hymenobacter yonginensis]WBO83805.1 hypothetical protein O9Z63_15660 [Hymenobacter yonginensis]